MAPAPRAAPDRRGPASMNRLRWTVLQASAAALLAAAAPAAPAQMCRFGMTPQFNVGMNWNMMHQPMGGFQQARMPPMMTPPRMPNFGMPNFGAPPAFPQANPVARATPNFQMAQL